MVGNKKKQKESDSTEQNKSKKSPKTSACENNPKDCYPPDGFLINQKFGIQLVVLLYVFIYLSIYLSINLSLSLSIMTMSLYFEVNLN